MSRRPATVGPSGASCTVCGRVGLRLRAGRCGTCRANAHVEACDRCGEVRTVSTRTETGAALCGTCRNRVRAAARTAELHASAAATIAGWLAGVDEAQLRAAVTAAAPNLRQAEWLVAALGEGAGVLHGSTTAPRVVDRLVEQLSAAGVTGIAAPCCVRCGRSAWLSQRIDGHRACVTCAHTVRGEPCSICGTTHPVATRTSAGAPV